MNKLKKILISLFLMVFIALGFIGNYFYNFALNPEVDKSSIVSQDSDGVVDEYFETSKKWFNDNKKELNMKSVTQSELTGYLFENNKSKKFVVVVHGYTSSAENMATYIKSFYDLGYNVFAPDLLAHGKSQGDFYTMGGIDSEDLANWIKKISEENNKPDIALFGISMGAATVMNVLDNNLPNNVKVVMEDSGYVDLDKQFKYQLKKLFGLPSFPIINSASTVAKIRAGYFISDVNATDALKNNNLPMLILHGEQDGFVPFEHAKDAYELVSSKKEFHSFKDAKHVKAERIYREQYWNIVSKFLNENFK